jgi:hypothetical protein
LTDFFRDIKDDQIPTMTYPSNMYCKNECDECAGCIGKRIQDRIFSECHGYQADAPTEEWFNDILDRVMQPEMDHFITSKINDEESEAFVAKYGISKAIKEYKEEFGEIPIRADLNVCKTLLYNIIEMNYLSLSYDSYKAYCIAFGLEGFEGEEGWEQGLEEETKETDEKTIIKQEGNDDILFWGATNGYLTIWKLPAELSDEFDTETFGNRHCLGEEWGGLSTATIRTITKKMMEEEDFE